MNERVEGLPPLEQARVGWERLQVDPYPGRGIVMGLDESGQKLIQLYWVMGRSEGSRNRILIGDNRAIRTEVFDRARETGDPQTTIYTTLLEVSGYHIVSNGAHTDTIASHLINGGTLEDAMSQWEYEPDSAQTPRIAAVAQINGASFHTAFAIDRPGLDGAGVERLTFTPPLERGIGWVLQTYEGDGSTDAFREEPYRVSLEGQDLEQIGARLWVGLNPTNLVSLVAKSVELQTGAATTRIYNLNSHQEKDL
jgi:hypothetical protein